MNFIMQSLLIHCNDNYLAFYIFTTLVEDYQLCENYQRDLPGVLKRCAIIEDLV